MVGVIPRTKRCGRDAGFRFDRPQNYRHLAASHRSPAIDEQFLADAPGVLPGTRGLRTHLSEDNWRTVRSSGTKWPSNLACPASYYADARTADSCGFRERQRSAAIET